MGLSLKREEMMQFLEAARIEDDSFKCMLWGTVYADLPLIKDRTLASIIMVFTPAPGVAAMPNNAFCYIGLGEKALYVIALDAYNTSKIIGTFILPFSDMTSLKIKKSKLSSAYTVEAECESGFVSLTVKGTAIGTDIKDQKERLEKFIQELDIIKNNI